MSGCLSGLTGNLISLRTFILGGHDGLIDSSIKGIKQYAM